MAETTYYKRWNAGRGAQRALGQNAVEGVDYTTKKHDDGTWTWTASTAPVVAKPDADLPTPPDFTASTHSRYRNKLAALVALVEARDVDGLAAFTAPAYSSSPRALLRYRDRALAVLRDGGHHA